MTEAELSLPYKVTQISRMSKRAKRSAAGTAAAVTAAPADPDVPRNLTEDEVKRVLEAIPYPNAITAEHSAFAREQILRVLRSDLTQIELAPSGLDELIQRVVVQFEESRVKPGSMVGFAAAEAPSQRFQQDNLSAVHRAGSVGMKATGGAVGRIAELVSKQQSKTASPNDSCTVFFNSIQTQHSILHDKRADMVAVNMTALLRTEDPYFIEYHSTLFPSGQLPIWYNIFSEIYGVPLPDLSLRPKGKILRLYLDVEKIVEYRIMTTDVRRALMSSNSRVVRYFISPMSLGIVDIWALDEEFHSYGLDISNDAELDVFNVLHGFAERLAVLVVKGIPGIRDVQAAKFDIWPIMTLGQSHRKIEGNVYEYRLSSIWPMRFGWERPRQLWHHLGITVQSYDEVSNSWVILDGSGAKTAGPPHEIIRDAVKADEDAALAWQRQAVDQRKTIVTRSVTPNDATYWSQLWYGKTDGTNLRQIIVRDDVDPRYTVSNRPFEVLELHGIVAARRIMLEELYLSFAGGREEPNFSVRHFALLADFVSHTGVIRPISNLLIQARSTLSKATFARQFNTLVTPAIHGVDEPIGDVSAAIMVAARAKIGPRAFEYDGDVSQGITAEQIKSALRSGSRSLSEMDKVMAAMTDTTDTPLYFTGREGAAAEDAERMGDEDDEAEAEYEANVAAFPPGLDDEDAQGAARAGKSTSELIIDDDEADVGFGERDEEAEPEVKSSRRRRRSGAPVMAPALRQVATGLGATLEPDAPHHPPMPTCPIRSSSRQAGRTTALTFVDDD